MLDQLDSVIAFVSVLLAVSLIVTVLNQMASTLFELRGRNLTRALRILFEQARGDSAANATKLADTIVRHPLISDSAARSGTVFSFWARASAIRIEELAAILDLVDAKPGATPPANRDAQTARTDLGRVGQWFDSVMDRSSQRFALQMRLWTAVFSLALALLLHLDSFTLFKTFANDREARARIIAASTAIAEDAGEILNRTPTTPGNSSSDDAWRAEMERLINRQQGLLGRFEASQLGLWPDGSHTPSELWGLHAHLLGVLATAALLSLGAPFWYNVLKRLSNLRPIIAERESQERLKRE